jgi:hypothetical protein
LVGQALPPANRSVSDQELAGESACPTFFMKFRGPKARVEQEVLSRFGGGVPKYAGGYARAFVVSPKRLSTQGQAGFSRLRELIGVKSITIANGFCEKYRAPDTTP